MADLEGSVKDPDLTALEGKVESAWDAEAPGGDDVAVDLTSTSTDDTPAASPAPTRTSASDSPATAADPKTKAEGDPASPAPAASAQAGDDDADMEYFLKRFGDPKDPETRKAAARHALDKINENARLTREVTELREKFEAAAPQPGDAPQPAAAVEDDIDPASIVASIESRMTITAKAYHAAEKVLRAKNEDRAKLQAELAEIQEELADPGPQTDGETLEWKSKKLQKKIAALDLEVRKADSDATYFHETYFQALQPQLTQAKVSARLYRQDMDRRHAGEQRAAHERKTAIRTNFFTTAEKIAKDAAVLDPELTTAFLGTPAKEYRDGWIRAWALSNIIQRADGTYSTIEDIPGFIKQAAVAFNAQGKAIHSSLSKSYAKTKRGDLPATGGGEAPAPLTREATLEDLEERTEKAWEEASV